MNTDTEQDIPNTFGVTCKNKYLTIAMVMGGLQFGSWKFEDLPDDVKKRLRDYLGDYHIGVPSQH